MPAIHVSTLKCCALAVCITCAYAMSNAAENPASKSTIGSGPLSALPSSPGETIAKIKGLGDNQWLNLGSPAADPKWGKARGRSWGPHMSFAPEMNAAFIFGEGVHSFVKPDGHYMDDLFVYDVNAHRWICVYPGANMKSLALKMDANGFEVDSKGQPIPLAQMTHAYEQITYDTDRRRFMFMPCGSINTNAPMREKRSTWGGGYAWPFHPGQCSPWMYNVASGRFEIEKIHGPAPGSSLAQVLVYVPSMKKAFYWIGGSQDVWFYTPGKNSWTKVSPKGTKPPFGFDGSACLDTKRDRIYLGGGSSPLSSGPSAFWCYNLKANEWVDLKAEGQPCGGCMRFGPNQAIMNYDTAADAVVLIYHRLPYGDLDGQFNPGEKALGVYVYEVAANTWSEKLAMPKEIGHCPSGFYCPPLGTHFIHVAGDSQDNGVMWVYRYKR